MRDPILFKTSSTPDSGGDSSDLSVGVAPAGNTISLVGNNAVSALNSKEGLDARSLRMLSMESSTYCEVGRFKLFVELDTGELDVESVTQVMSRILACVVA